VPPKENKKKCLQTGFGAALAHVVQGALGSAVGAVICQPAHFAVVVDLGKKRKKKEKERFF